MSSIFRKLATQTVRNARKSHDYNVPSNFKYPNMDDLPVPSGSWQEYNNAMQAKYNRHLILGSGFFIVTLIVAKTSGLFFFNWNPPPFPVKKE